MNNVIFLFGASCSGKSTLGIALCKSLGHQWTYIDRDDLIEKNLCMDSTANAVLDEKIKSIRQNIIIDAQIPWRKKRKGEFYFMVLPPLKVLLERNEKRDKQLQRSGQRAYYARKYVLETYNALANLNKREFNHCFDSSKESVQDEINAIRSIINKPDFYVIPHAVNFATFEGHQSGPALTDQKEVNIIEYLPLFDTLKKGHSEPLKSSKIDRVGYKFIHIAIVVLVLSVTYKLFVGTN